MLRKGAFLFLLVGLVVALTACAPTVAPTPSTPTKAPTGTEAKGAEATKPPAPTPTPKPASLKFGTIPAAGFAGIYLAVEKGYFKEQAIDMEMISVRTVQDLVAPLGTGQLDVIAMGVTPALLAAADRGVDFRIVASTHESRPGNEYAWVVLRKDLKESGQVKTVADLKGRKMSIMSLGGTGDQVAQVLIEQAGLKTADVELVVLPGVDAVVALANKAIDAAGIAEPNVAVAIQRGLGEKWVPLSAIFGGKMQAGLVVFGPSMLKDQDLARRWLIAYLKGSRDYLKAMTSKGEREVLFNVLDKYSPVQDRKLYDYMEFPYVDPNGALDKTSIDAQYKWWVEKGFYTGKKTFDDITDLTYVEYAAQKLGKQ